MALALGQFRHLERALAIGARDVGANFSKPVFEMWIKPMRFISFHGNELHLAVHSKFAQEWVGSKLRLR